jgi:hypothetical protein
MSYRMPTPRSGILLVILFIIFGLYISNESVIWHPCTQHMGPTFSLIPAIASNMSSFSPDKAPVEIWERILQEVITFDSNIALQATCSPETYLAFKGTCADGGYDAPMGAYVESEKDRCTMRLVCRSWKTFAEDWKYRDRWVKLRPYEGAEGSLYSLWELPSRIDIRFQTYGISLASRSKVNSLAQDWLHAWRDRDPSIHRPMQLTRLELLNIYPTAAFNELFEALCEAAGQLGRLRSLSLNIPTRNPWLLDALSGKFPQLTHLTLNMWFTDLSDEPVTHYQSFDPHHKRGALSLDNLEILLLRTDPGCFDLTHWLLPKLHTVQVDPFSREWNNNIFPFLRNHARTIETLDLDGFSYREPPRNLGNKKFALPIGFWEQFNHLQFFRTRLQYIHIVELPKKGHGLKWLAYANPLNDAHDWLKALQIWARSHEGANPRQILMHGNYIKKISGEDLGGAIGLVLQGLRRNGIELVDIGKPRVGI